MEEKIRVVLADDHPLIRAGLRMVLDDTTDISLVADAGTTNNLARLCALQQADILLLDVTMPGPGLEATLQAMQQHCPRVNIIILSAVADVAVVKMAVELGAKGYILKDEAPEMVATAVRTVMGGAAWYSMAVLRDLVQPSTETMTVSRLTERETQVLGRLSQGWTNIEIAQGLNLSEQTIRNYTTNIYAKIGVDSRSNAVLWAIQHGLAHDPAPAT